MKTGTSYLQRSKRLGIGTWGYMHVPDNLLIGCITRCSCAERERCDDINCI
jgi:hypothetical protein